MGINLTGKGGKVKYFEEKDGEGCGKRYYMHFYWPIMSCFRTTHIVWHVCP